MRLLGLDGCKQDAWVVAESDSEFKEIRFSIVFDLKPLFDKAVRGEVLAVLDVPIGLIHKDRACDKAARVILRPKASSVFRPPCREALAASTYAEAQAINRAHCDGVAISKQAFNIRQRIKSVDDLITPELQKHVRESHPEVVFAMLNGGRPIEEGKKTPGGLRKRVALLLAAGMPSFDPLVERVKISERGVGADDIVDAAAMLLAAQHLTSGSALTIPGTGEADARGLRMEVVSPPTRPKGLTKSQPNSQFQFQVWVNPLTLGSITTNANVRCVVDATELLGFLCTPGTDASPESVAQRYVEISASPANIVAAPYEQHLLNKLVWPLREAKSAYPKPNAADQDCVPTPPSTNT